MQQEKDLGNRQTASRGRYGRPRGVLFRQLTVVYGRIMWWRCWTVRPSRTPYRFLHRLDTKDKPTSSWDIALYSVKVRQATRKLWYLKYARAETSTILEYSSEEKQVSDFLKMYVYLKYFSSTFGSSGTQLLPLIITDVKVGIRLSSYRSGKEITAY